MSLKMLTNKRTSQERKLSTWVEGKIIFRKTSI